MNEPELKPCPFCGSGDIKSAAGWFDDYTVKWGAWCENCGVCVFFYGDTEDYYTDEKIIKDMWNKRIVNNDGGDGELKHCPFCGGDAILRKTRDSHEWWVFCLYCNAFTIPRYRLKMDAIKRWNTRVEVSADGEN